jgi:hypothetical protein
MSYLVTSLILELSTSSFRRLTPMMTCMAGRRYMLQYQHVPGGTSFQSCQRGEGGGFRCLRK